MAALAPTAAARETWRAPVDGPVTKPFHFGPDPFAPGSHRGADFEARPGATVRAACSGRVVVAGRVGTSGRLVTIACGPWRATHMPLATITVHTGASVHRGAKLGTVAPSSHHAGLHLGARRAGDRFGYVDPLTLIGDDRPPPVPFAAPRAGRRTPHAHPAPRPALAPPPRVAHPRRVPHPRPVPGRVGPAPRRAPVPASPRPARPAAPAAVSAAGDARGASAPLAPWPAWAGLAALLGGAVGTGVRVRVRMRARAGAASVPAAQEVR